MKIKLNIIPAVSISMILAMGLFTTCKEEKTGPPTVPIKAEIKQVIINNSLYTAEFQDENDTDGVDTVVVTIPQGTDVTSLEMDIIYSYFGKIEPEVVETTDLSSPKTFTVTANIGDPDYEESRDYIVIANVVPPNLTSFMITSPREVVAKISGDSILFELQEGLNYSNVGFVAEYFGESITPSMEKAINLDTDSIISVTNKEFQNDYTIYIEWYKVIEFTGFIYDCTVHPNEILPGAIGSEDSAFVSIVDDSEALGGKVVRFTSLEYSGNNTGSINFDYGDLGLDDQPDEITVIMRGRGYATHPVDHRYVEIVVHLGFWRFQFWVEYNGLDGTDYSQLAFEDIPAGLDPFVWNTYRLTANRVTGEVHVYLNESKDPLAEMEPLALGIRSSENWKAGFGDGSGGNTYDGEYDYFIIETGGAYSPEDLPLSKI